MNIAFFDFDGTITFSDTFASFVDYSSSRRRVLCGTLLLSPLILGYRLRVLGAARLRQSVVRFGFRGRSESELRSLGARYGREVLPTLVRPNARARIEWHKQRGDVVVVVSASLDVYLEAWCEAMGLALLANQPKREPAGSPGVMSGRSARERARWPESSSATTSPRIRPSTPTAIRRTTALCCASPASHTFVGKS
jgi:HAD superfamily phosphoserine phosphatase-like hydrolase